MKTLKYILLLSLVTLVSCQQARDNSNQQNNQFNNVCVTNPSACQPQVYQQGQGFQPYNYYGQNSYNNGYPGTNYNGVYHTNNGSLLCNCPAGTIPTYNNFGGLGCVQSNYISGSFGLYAYLGFGGSFNQQQSQANNTHWVNIPQISNFTGYNQSNCYNGVVQSCLVDQPNTCTSGYTCTATAAQSRLGLCTSNTSNQGNPVIR